MQLDDIHSSVIHSVRYERDTCSLWVRFRAGHKGPPKGHWFEYLDVPEQVFETLRQIADAARNDTNWYAKGGKRFSVGTFFHTQVKSVYDCTSHPIS